MKQNEGVLHFFIGMGLVLLFHIIVFAFLYLIGILGGLVGFYSLSGIAIVAFFGIGLSQLLYVIPIVIFLFIKQKRMMAYGVITAAGITILLNGACYGLIFISLSTANFH